MKRFWTAVVAEARPGGVAILLDGRPLRTPAKAELLLPSAALSEAVAAEWAAAGETIDPRAMPLTGLANVAIDRVAPDPAGFAAALAKYAESDLACYRAEGPRPLAERQAGQWDALLGWARRRFDVDFVVTTGILHVDQPPATVRRLTHAVALLDSFRLAGLAPLVTIGGSLIAALALLDKGLTADRAWAAVSVDERWQLDQWGSDAEAELTLANRGRDFLAAALFLDLLE